MGIGLTYKDSVTLVKPVLPLDGYTTEIVGETAVVPCLLISNTRYTHNSNRNEIQSDAEVYIDPENQFVIDNVNRLEGMMVIADRFGSDDAQSWYRIITVRVGEDKLLTDTIDNILCFLKKSTEIPYVS